MPNSAITSHFRSLARQAVSLPGALRGSGPDQVWNRDVRVVDLGLGGACVEISDAVPPGTSVELVLDTPHLWDPLELSGAVAWARTLPELGGGGVLLGVRFQHAGGGVVRALTELLEAEAFG